jgi:hypothetical protein
MVRVMTREEILAGDTKPNRVEITIKEWGGTFYIQEWSGMQRDAWEAAIVANRDNSRAVTAVHSLFLENGTRLFQDEDADSLGAKPGLGKLLSRIASLSRKVNRFHADDVEEAKGNSEPDRSGDSAST